MAEHITRRNLKKKRPRKKPAGRRPSTGSARRRSRIFAKNASRRGSKKRLRFEDEFSQSRPEGRRGSRRPGRIGIGESGRAKLASKRTKRMIAGLAAVAAGIFLFYLFVFILPSPIASVSPEEGSVLSTKRVDLEVVFKDEMDIRDISLYFDNESVLPKCGFDGKVLRCGCDVKDGEHVARLNIAQSGWPKTRTTTWKFTVDATPPSLDAELVRDEKGGDGEKGNPGKYKVKGKTEAGAEVSVDGKSVTADDKGAFEVTVGEPDGGAIVVRATDQAGNSSEDWLVTQQSPAVKGVHVTIWKASKESNFDDYLEMVESTELNSLVVDTKNVEGTVLFESDEPLAEDIGSDTIGVDPDALVDHMRYRDIYPICRQPVFRDSLLASGRPDLSVQDKYGGPWGDGGWVDPYSQEVWDYNIGLAEEAARAGFQEIQFDYVRFPSDGDVTRCKYPSKDDRNQQQVIADFLEYARKRLAKYNVFISADLFGLTASEQGEMGIGQRVKTLAEHVDYVCPMVYPSHYASGEYDIKNPEANPHDIVYESILEFKEQIEGTGAKIRPWLQDFSINVTYTADEVRRQISAVEEHDIDEWMLWNPYCIYTDSALRDTGDQ